MLFILKVKILRVFKKYSNNNIYICKVKRNIYLIMLLVLTACSSNKERPSSIIIGDTEDMIVTEVNETFNGVYVGEYEVNTRTKTFDIDNDGDDDFTIYSSVDSVINTRGLVSSYQYKVSFESYSLKLKAIEKHFGESESIFLGDSLIPGYIINIYHTILSSCDSNSMDESMSDIFYTNYELNDDLDANGFNYLESHISENICIYQTNGMEAISSYAKLNYIEKDYSCTNPGLNTPFYMGIQDISGGKKLGWIELSISENNTVHLIRTAIQE